MFVLSSEESDVLRSKFSTTKVSSKSRVLPKVFTEKGLYMLATILKSKNALNVTFAIIETFTQVRCLKRELVDLHKETDFMQVGVKSSPDSFSAIAFILSKYRIVSSEFEEIMKLIDKEIKKTIPPIVSIIS